MQHRRVALTVLAAVSGNGVTVCERQTSYVRYGRASASSRDIRDSDYNIAESA